MESASRDWSMGKSPNNSSTLPPSGTQPPRRLYPRALSEPEEHSVRFEDRIGPNNPAKLLNIRGRFTQELPHGLIAGKDDPVIPNGGLDQVSILLHRRTDSFRGCRPRQPASQRLVLDCLRQDHFSAREHLDQPSLSEPRPVAAPFSEALRAENRLVADPQNSVQHVTALAGYGVGSRFMPSGSRDRSVHHNPLTSWHVSSGNRLEIRQRRGTDCPRRPQLRRSPRASLHKLRAHRDWRWLLW